MEAARLHGTRAGRAAARPRRRRPLIDADVGALASVRVSVMPASAVAGRPDPTIRWAPLRGQQVTWALWENGARDHSDPVREARRLIVETAAGAARWKRAVTAR